MAIVIGWWLALLQPTTVRADLTITARSVGLARQEVQFQCGRALDAQCFDRGLDRATDAGIGWPQCDEDDEGTATCTVACSGTCTERADEP